MIINPSQEDVRADYTRYLSRATILVHSPQTTASIQNMLGGSDPVSRVAKATVMIMQRLDTAARKQGIEVQDTVKVYAASEIVTMVAELGEAAGKMKALTPQLHELALSVTVQDYVKGEVQAGRIDPKKLNQELQEGLRNLPPKDREEIEAAQSRIQKTAKQYNMGKGRA